MREIIDNGKKLNYPSEYNSKILHSGHSKQNDKIAHLLLSDILEPRRKLLEKEIRNDAFKVKLWLFIGY